MLTVNYGTKANYAALATKSEDALYFCTDTRELFKGSTLYTEPVRFLSGSDLPAAKAQGVLYVTSAGVVKVWDGSAEQTIAYPVTTSISSSSTDAQVPSAAAVYGYAAPLASPVFTGTPEAPTAAEGTNTTQIATTAFVKTACDAISASLASAFEFKGVVADLAALEAITGQSAGDVYQVTDAGSGKSNAEFVWVDGDPSGSWVELGTVVDLSGYAPLNSPVFTGNPTAPTPTAGDNSTSIATTAFVAGEVQSALTWVQIPAAT